MPRRPEVEELRPGIARPRAAAALAAGLPEDLVNQEVTDIDIHEVLKDPHKFLNKKIRIVGRIASSFEYAEMVDSHGEKLGILPEIQLQLGEFIAAAGLKKELGSNDQPREFLGYLESGGHFGHMGGSSKEFTIVEVYPADADRARKAQIKKQYLEYLEKVTFDTPIPDLIDTADIARARQALQGSWTVIAAENRGRNFSRPQGLALGDLRRPDHDRIAREWSRGKFRIDPRRRPAAIDCDLDDTWGEFSRHMGIFLPRGRHAESVLVGGHVRRGRRPREFLPIASSIPRGTCSSSNAIPSAQRCRRRPTPSPPSPTTLMRLTL